MMELKTACRGKLPEEVTSSRHISGVSVGFCFEHPEIDAGIFDCDLSLPPTTAVYGGGTLQSSALRRSVPITQIVGTACFAEIGKPVVMPNAVYMVNFRHRPASVRQKPGEAMDAVAMPVNVYTNVSTRLPVAYGLRQVFMAEMWNTSEKKASFWLVQEQFSGAFISEHGHHVNVLAECCQ